MTLTREEAIERLKQNKAAAEYYAGQSRITAEIENALKDSEAFDMAIEALSERTGEWICKGDDYAVCSECGGSSGTQFDGVERIPKTTAFAPTAVRKWKPKMSNKKKIKQKKRTYTEGEVRNAIRKVSDEAVSKILLLCIVAAKDEFKLDENGLVSFMETMQRYVDYEKKGLIKTDEASKSLLKDTGIDLRLSKC